MKLPRCSVNNMTIYDKIQAKLEAEPRLRERRFSRDYLMNSALEDCGLWDKWIEGRHLSLQDLQSLCSKHDSWRHEWDAVTRQNPHLRGRDYCDKTKYTQQKKMEFGYEGGFDENIKRGMRIARELAEGGAETPTEHDTFYEEHPEFCN